MTMRSLIIAAHTIREEGMFNLKITGQLPGCSNHMRFGVLKGESLLRDVLNKGVRTITSYEVSEIANRRVAIKVQTGVKYALVLQIVGGFAALLAVGAYYTLKLRHLNR